ncbi:MAG: 16S rRNA (uracil(1498)-N(3))-methyltransferase [Clostridiales bacterium]|nr:16S rRNA (uracil(1498)-N(3))-methyltransferase [Clostridiales bacterium]
MHRFFADFLDENSAVLNEEEAAHALKVLRLRQRDACQALMDGSVYEATISQIQPQVILQLEEKLPSPEPSIRVTLYQGLPKGDKMDFLSQKCTEAGIFRIVPVLFSRCVVKWEKKDDEKKLPRWQRIAAEAAKQSGRAIVPEIGRPVTLKQLCEELKEYDLALVPWEDQKGNGIRQQFAGQKNIAVVIGPEGGMAPEEIEMMRQSGARPVTLGPRIFRTETAGLAALISLMTLSGDME